MSDVDEHGTGRRATGLAWAVVLLVCAALAGNAAREKHGGDGDAALRSPVSQIDLKLLVAERSLGRTWATEPDVSRRLAQPDAGPGTARLPAAAVAAELLGAAAGRARLDAYEQSGARTPDDDAAAALLRTLWATDAADEIAARADALTDAERQTLATRLSWAGRLAARPAGTRDGAGRAQVLGEARRLGATLLIVAAIAAALFVTSLVLLGGAAIGAATGRFRARFDVRRCEGVPLLPTFAAWLTVLGATVLASRALPWIGVIGMPLSLLALVWPARRVGWTRLRVALGWTRGRGLLREIMWGVAAYVAGLPIVFAGFIASALLAMLARRLGLPADASHPIVHGLPGADTAAFAGTLFLAAVAAPFLEETFFRGALYGHLRGATRTWSRSASVLVSAVTSALLFAAVHPQSWIGVPVIASLGVAFALAREWRGSLIAPMVAHALTNAGTLSLARTLLS